MKVFFVYSHADPMSYGAALHNRALSFFERNGHQALVSDLYASGFQAVAAKWDFNVSGGVHQNYMQEQRRTAKGLNDSAFAEDIKDEINKLRSADLLVIEFPLWWSAPPAIMKGWFDKVFAAGITWDEDHRYGSGLMRGKQCLIITTAGDPMKNYSPDGIHGATVTQHLYPLLHSTIAHAGIDVLEPYVAGGLTFSDETERQKMLDELEIYLQKALNDPTFIYKF